MSDPRPANCRFRLQDEGKDYPRSSCPACGRTVTTGLGNKCDVYPPTPADGDADAPLPEKDGKSSAITDWKAGFADGYAAGTRDTLNSSVSKAEREMLRKALREMVYETTHLSPVQDDGSHWAKISGSALAQARAALSGSKDNG